MFNELGYNPEVVFRLEREPSGIWRKLTSGKRMLPKIFIPGSQKSGTTSLFAYLHNHPQILPPQLKEPFFFGDDYRYAKGLSFYRPNFPLGREFQAAEKKTEKKIFSIDASTNYLEHPQAPERIAKLIPGAKIVILLRNPVDRAYSHYRMAVRNLGEGLSFEDALEKENERILKNGNKNSGCNDCYFYLGYRSRGEYAPMIKNWMQQFDKNQLQIFCSEDFFSETKKTYEEILNFLGLEYEENKVFDVLNKGDDDDPINETTRKLLADHYRPFNNELEKLINKNFCWDKINS